MSEHTRSAPVAIPHHDCCPWCRHPVHAEVIQWEDGPTDTLAAWVGRWTAALGWVVVAIEPAPEARVNTMVIDPDCGVAWETDAACISCHLLVFRASPTPPGEQP